MFTPTPLNNVTGLYLAAPHASGATSLVLNPGAGDQIRAAIAELEADDVSTDHPIRATVAKVATVNSYGQINDRTQLCIFDVTELSGDTLGGLAPVEGKTDLGFAAGDRVGFFLTADMLRTAAANGPVSSSQLPNSGVAPGSYSLATYVVDAKGRITSATTNAVNGLLKANGSGVVAVGVAGTDYVTPAGLTTALSPLAPKASPTFTGTATFMGQATFNTNVVLANGVSILGSGASDIGIGDGNDTVFLCGGAMFAFPTKVYTNTPFYAGSNIAGSANARLEATAVNASSNAAALYSSDGALAFVVGPKCEVKYPHLADSVAANDSDYYSTDQSKRVYKDSGGVVHPYY